MRKMLLPFVTLFILSSTGFFPGGGWRRPPILSSLAEARKDGHGLAVVVFFSVDCQVCFEDLFDVRRLIDGAAGPVELIGVTRGDRAGLEEFMDRYRIDIPLVLDRRNESFKKFGVRGTPCKLVLAGDEVIYRDDGLARREVQYEELRKCLNSVFSRSPAG